MLLVINLYMYMYVWMYGHCRIFSNSLGHSVVDITATLRIQKQSLGRCWIKKSDWYGGAVTHHPHYLSILVRELQPLLASPSIPSFHFIYTPNCTETHFSLKVLSSLLSLIRHRVKLLSFISLMPSWILVFAELFWSSLLFLRSTFLCSFLMDEPYSYTLTWMIELGCELCLGIPISHLSSHFLLINGLFATDLDSDAKHHHLKGIAALGCRH